MHRSTNFFYLCLVSYDFRVFPPKPEEESLHVTELLLLFLII